MKVLVLSSRTGKSLEMLHELYRVHSAVCSAKAPWGVVRLNTPRTEEQWEALNAMRFDIAVSLGFMSHIPAAFFRRTQTINVHPGKLPLFKGKDPQLQALKAGVEWTAVTVHRVVEEIDSGKILVEVPVRITNIDHHLPEFEDRLRTIAVYTVAALLHALEV